MTNKRRPLSFSVENIITGLRCRTDEQKDVVGKLRKNSDGIRIPRGMTEDRMREILQEVVILLAVNWGKDREEIKMFKDALPYLENLVEKGVIDNVILPPSLCFTSGNIVGKRESATDYVRAVKQAVSVRIDYDGEPPPDFSWIGSPYPERIFEKPNHALVADILNAYFEPLPDIQWDAEKVARI